MHGLAHVKRTVHSLIFRLPSRCPRVYHHEMIFAKMLPYPPSRTLLHPLFAGMILAAHVTNAQCVPSGNPSSQTPPVPRSPSVSISGDSGVTVPTPSHAPSMTKLPSCEGGKKKQVPPPCRPDLSRPQGCRPLSSKSCEPVGTARNECPAPPYALRDQSMAAWLSASLSSHPAVSHELEALRQISGSRPTISVKLGNFIPPSRQASFPLGLSSGRSIEVVVDLPQSPSCLGFEKRVGAALATAYRELSANYYKLGTAQQRNSLLVKRLRSLEALRELNREAANAGAASWAEVVYLESLASTVRASLAANDLEIESLSWGFLGSPALRSLREGRMYVWSPDDFWSFYPKHPPVPIDQSRSSVERLAAQFGCLMVLQEANRQFQTMTAIYNQVRSENQDSWDGMPAATEIQASAKSKDADARLGYIESMLSLHPPITVGFTRQAHPSPSPEPSAVPQEPATGSSAKVIGILVLGLGVGLVLWASVWKATPADEQKPEN
jgi:hypothetical protein